MKGYTSVQKIENYLLITIEDYFKPQVEKWIEEIEDYIDKTTLRNFASGDVKYDRFFDGNCKDELFIDDFIETESKALELKIDDVVITDTDILRYPANKTPKVALKLKKGIFKKGNQNITAKALWGYSKTPPKDIEMAATTLVAGIINFSMTAEGEIASMTIGRYSVTYKNERQWADYDRIAVILKSYYRKRYHY